MKNLLFVILIILLFSSCGEIVYINYPDDRNTYSGLISSDTITKTFPSTVGLSALEIGANIETTIKYGTSYTVVIQGDRQDMLDLSVLQKGNRMVIRYANFKQNRYKMFANITIPHLTNLISYGATITKVSNFPKFENLDIDLSGASILDISGSCKDLKAKLSGATVFNGLGFNVDYVRADVSGAGVFKIQVTKELEVRASGASKIEYLGNPSLKITTSGASTITKL